MDTNRLGELGEITVKSEFLKFKSPSNKYNIDIALLGDKYELNDLFGEVVFNGKRYPFLLQCKTSEIPPTRFSLNGSVKSSHITTMKKYNIPSIVAFAYYNEASLTVEDIAICAASTCKNSLGRISKKNSIFNNSPYIEIFCEAIVNFFDKNPTPGATLSKEFNYARR